VGSKGGKKRRKQRHQEIAPVVGDDGGNNKQTGTSDRQWQASAWLPTDHFEKPLEETCPNHLYPVKHKLKNCNMMKNIMAPGSLAKAWKSTRSPMRATQRPSSEKMWS
jgi:hypothetical protein